ncbi:hypothetical protein HOL21_04825 [Candidatus Woesearchaeota archaeon]|jgi:hypothetical protein|nr:hypothetical protein [Candidatus Woesearchaeota archaeon]MBT5397510.1 hypothetical protein [Candidatus Woesearchaeota archaeon]MBT5924143.1 hypothetical protein [Candidatus Woesearchaeota archaeon]MBT6367917.1 hypothetical protein [Candidatus Woesearchaeota archaeon]MBT7763141.1 hypothetical protein [Candidatus Woesearchaeota archaeon]
MEKDKNVKKGSLEEDSQDSTILGPSNEYEDLWKEKLNSRTKEATAEEKAEEVEQSTETEKVAPNEQNTTKRLDKDVTIKFNTRNTVKWTGIVLLFILVFFVGRLSVVDTVGTTADDADVSGTLGSFFGLFSGDSDAAENDGAGEEVAAGVDSGITGAVVVDDTELEPVVDDTDTVDENVVTTYDGVSVALGEIKTEWKGTWGRIKGISYTIKNMEEGTVEPDHFVLMVEGYDDLEKKVPLSPGSKSIKSKTSASSYVLVPGGFSYSEITTGDLNSVGITIQLYDAADKLMDATNKMADLGE